MVEQPKQSHGKVEVERYADLLILLNINELRRGTLPQLLEIRVARNAQGGG